MYFCTLFDSSYLNRGLVMYESLQKTCPGFHLYIFAFDEISESILKGMQLTDATIISLQEFENERLLNIKSTRSTGEYCWTCTPSVIEYCLEEYLLQECTYVDADLYFFSNPMILFLEMENDSVLITDHRYTKKYDDSDTSGIYCVQFITFRNDQNGREILSWWRDKCIEWCYARFEDGKFGDQKYLDDWPTRFKGVRVLQYEGGGIAPWNIQQYEPIFKNSNVILRNKASKKTYDLIFYHFHAVKFLKNNIVDMGAYRLSDSARKIIYTIYINEIHKVDKLLAKIGFQTIKQEYKSKKYIPAGIHKLVRKMLGVYNKTRIPCLNDNELF